LFRDLLHMQQGMKELVEDVALLEVEKIVEPHS
jgi:hypothetical protein